MVSVQPITPDHMHEELAEDGEEEPDTRTILVSPMLAPQMLAGGPGGRSSHASLESIKEPWVQFFEQVLASNSSRRVVYLEAAESMAPSFAIWWTSFIEAVRRSRRGKGKGKKPEVEQEIAIVLSFSPSLLSQNTAPIISNTSRARPPANDSHMHPLQAILAQRFGIGSDARDEEAPAPLWYGGDESDHFGRERRVGKRLAQLQDGDVNSLIPFSTKKESRGTSILDMIQPLRAQSNEDDDLSIFELIIWKSLPLIPEKRDRKAEMLERLSTRAALSAAIIHNALAPYGARLADIDASLREVGEKSVYKNKADRNLQTMFTVASERRAAGAFDLPAVRQSHLGWQNATLSLLAGQKVAAAAVGQKLRTQGHNEPLIVSWSDVIDAANVEREQSKRFRSQIDSLMPTAAVTRTSTQSGGPLHTSSSSIESTSSVIAAVKSATDLSAYERRLLPCIVDSSKLSAGTFDHVHLPVHTVDTVRTLVTLPLLFPEAFRSGVLRDHSTAGALLFGPPGTGKTLLARAVANESGARMLAIQPSDVNDKYLGEGEKL